MLAVGFVLSGCAPPDEPDGTAQGEQESEKAAKDERPTKEKPEQERPDPEPKEEAKPEPQPEAQKANNEPAPPPPKPEPRPEPPSAGSSASASASAFASPAAGGGNYDATVTVSRVVDGDTIEVSPGVNGNEEVRLIGMDTPETKDPSEEVEPLGPEASAFATDSLTGRSVGLEFDVEREDQYGRLLAYAYLGGEMFNEELVEEGYAQAYPYEPNTRYEGRFAAAQEEARIAGLGIWGLAFSQQCLLADRGNGIGEGTPGCSGATASAGSSASSSATATGPYEGGHYRLEEPMNNPPPLGDRHPPIMVGGMGEQKTLRLVARYADACNLFAYGGPDLIRHKLDVIRRHCEDVGRDYEEIERTSLGTVHLPPGEMGVDDVIGTCRDLAGAGIQHAIFNMPNVHDIEPLETFGREIIPAVADL